MCVLPEKVARLVWKARRDSNRGNSSFWNAFQPEYFDIDEEATPDGRFGIESRLAAAVMDYEFVSGIWGEQFRAFAQAFGECSGSQ